MDLRIEADPEGVRLLACCRISDIASLDLECDGADALIIDDDGRVSVRTAVGDMFVQARHPTSPPIVSGRTIRIPLRKGTTSVAKMGGPDLAYGSFFGGADTDEGYGVASHWPGTGATRTFVCGRTSSATIFPAFPAGSFDVTQNGLFDAFVLKLNGAGTSLVYATYIGGSQDDAALDMVVDSSGNGFVTGLTNSTGFPTTTGAFDTSYNGAGDAFTFALDSSGASLSFSTFLGGTAEDIGYGIAIDGSANVYVTGQTSSTGFPLLNPAPKNDKLNGTGSGSSSDGFVTKLAAGGGSLTYSTYISGDLSDGCTDIVLDRS